MVSQLQSQFHVVSAQNFDSLLSVKQKEIELLQSKLSSVEVEINTAKEYVEREGTCCGCSVCSHFIVWIVLLILFALIRK